MADFTMTGPSFCNLGAQGVCPLHQVDHNYGAWLGPPIEPAPCLTVCNVTQNTVRLSVCNGPALFHAAPGEAPRVFQPGDWT